MAIDEERFLLDRFFTSFLKHDCLGHVVLHGTKPACFAAIDKKCRRKSYRQRLLLKGWHCWKKNEDLFQHPNFLFLEEEFFIGEDVVFHIFIINKKTLLVTLYNNLSLFQERLGTDFSPENFILSIEQAGKLRPLLQHDEALFGCILGFGIESPLAYKEKLQELPKKSENYTGVEATIPKKCKLFPVEFMGNPYSEEVQDLLAIYSQELSEVWQTYKTSKNHLQLILEHLSKK